MSGDVCTQEQEEKDYWGLDASDSITGMDMTSLRDCSE